MSESQSKNIGGLIINLFVFLIKFMLQPFAVIWYMFTFQAEEFCRGIYKIFAYMLIMALCIFEIIRRMLVMIFSTKSDSNALEK